MTGVAEVEPAPFHTQKDMKLEKTMGNDFEGINAPAPKDTGGEPDSSTGASSDGDGTPADSNSSCGDGDSPNAASGDLNSLAGSGGGDHDGASQINDTGRESKDVPSSEEEPLYPLRPGRPDCSFYMHTGMCKYGKGCRWHHPSKIRGRPYEEPPRNNGKSICDSWAMEGRCKLGAVCKFDHPFTKKFATSMGLGGEAIRGMTATLAQPQHQLSGVLMPPPPMAYGAPSAFPYPVRPGEPLCTFFLKNGSCKYEATCKFDHPEDCPAYLMLKQQAGNIAAGVLPPPHLVDSRMVMGMKNGWMEGAVLVPSGRAALPASHLDAVQQQVVAAYPQRHDQPECAYYVRTGMCRYGQSCRFDHPPERASAEASLREEEKVDRVACQHFMFTGSCAYGVTCRFRHSVSADSLSTQQEETDDKQEQQQQQQQQHAIHHLNGGADDKSTHAGSEQGHLPSRPGVQSCQFYMRTGKCAYGSRCKWDHPKSRSIPRAAAVYAHMQGPHIGLLSDQGVPPGSFPVGTYMHAASFPGMDERHYVSSLSPTIRPLAAPSDGISMHASGNGIMAGEAAYTGQPLPNGVTILTGHTPLEQQALDFDRLALRQEGIVQQGGWQSARP